MFTNQLQRPVLGMLLIAFEMYPVVESMRAREPGLQAPSNLAGSKTKNANIFWSIKSFSEFICDKFFTFSKSHRSGYIVLK